MAPDSTMPRMEIRGSGALVAGGASGLGAATARRLAAAGAAVTIADIDEARGASLAAEIGGRFLPTDVRDEAQVAAAVSQAAEQAGGGLRIAASCAGIGPAEKVAGSRGPHRLETFERVIAINLIGTFNVLRFAAQAMLG